MKENNKKILATALSVSLAFTMAINVSAYNVQAKEQSTVQSISGENVLSKSENLLTLANLASTSSSLASTGIHTNLYDIEDSAFSNAIYVSADGSSDATGTKSNPIDLASAIEQTALTDNRVILLKEGTYSLINVITIGTDNNGSSSAYKILKACKGANVTLDFSSESYNSSDTSVNQRGIQLNGDYWYMEGITISGAADNGMMLSGSHNVIERCIFDSNRDTGLQISRSSSSITNYDEWPSYNNIINCTSKNNCDPASYENADGFASKLTCGDGNVFDGCLSHNNSDDGWDLYAKTATGPIGVVTIKNCIAMRNGVTEDGTTKSSCDGNGFKLGGSGVGTPHVITNCLSIENLHHGFTDNNNPSALQVVNCTAFNNNTGGSKNNFSLYRCNDAYVANCLSYTTNNTSDKFVNLSAEYLVLFNSSKWYKVTDLQVMNTGSSASRGTAISTGITSSDFINATVPTVGTNFDTLWRNSDGTLNTNGVAVISTSSDYATFSTDGSIIGARFSSNNASTLLTVNSNNDGNTNNNDNSDTDDQDESSTVETITNIQNFTESGLNSDFFTISGNLSTSKGTITYNNLALTTALKIESSTNISFTTSIASTLTLIFNEDCNKNIMIDGNECSISNGLLEIEFASGAHTISKADSINLYYMSVVSK
ncbi:MAG: right-handed parallel beta-helix repeat-containing protein [Lachnotalea sp.]